MSDSNKVVWSEGLFLRTQHFQQQDRYTEALVRGALRAAPHQSWGFTALELDTASLNAGQVSIASAAGILPDGTPFDIPGDMDAPTPVPVGRDTGAGLVLLGVPVAVAGTRHGRSGTRTRGRGALSWQHHGGARRGARRGRP